VFGTATSAADDLECRTHSSQTAFAMVENTAEMKAALLDRLPIGTALRSRRYALGFIAERATLAYPNGTGTSATVKLLLKGKTWVGPAQSLRWAKFA